jgi:hypothetical protein
MLRRAIDLGEEGWFGGDVHVHANHGTPHYTVTPIAVRRIGRARRSPV